MNAFVPHPRPVIGIVDPCCPQAYGPGATGENLGGTEATVLKVTGALSDHFAFRLYQSGRKEGAVVGGITALPLTEADHAGCDALIVINSWKAGCRLRARHPATPISLWLHIFPGRHNRAMGAALRSASVDVVCVSQSHADALHCFLSGGEMPVIRHIWNPIADDLRPDATPRDPDLLFFASSPHKGLAEVLARFAALRARMPDLRLDVADPGYLRWDVGPIPAGVTLLGRLNHAGVVARLRRALCLFYPQSSFRETFGLVLAEANAVGTPALVQSGLGANDEVLRGAGQCVDVTDGDLLMETVQGWQQSYPVLATRDGFRLNRVAAQWTVHIRQMLEAAFVTTEVDDAR